MTDFTVENIQSFIEWTEDMAKRAAPMKGLVEPYVVMNAMFKELLAYRTGKAVVKTEEQKDAEFSDNSWEANLKYLLDTCPHAVRSHPGNGPECLKESLVITFRKMQSMIARDPLLNPKKNAVPERALRELRDMAQHASVADEISATGAFAQRVLDIISDEGEKQETFRKVYISEHVFGHLMRGGAGMFDISPEPYGDCVHALYVDAG